MMMSKKAAPEKAPTKVNNCTQDKVFMVVVYALLSILMIVMLYPMVFVISASFSDPNLVATGQMLLWPVGVRTDGYEYILQYSEIWSGYLNTIVYTLLGTILNLAVTLPCAFALSRKDMKGRGFLMGIFMVTMYVNGGMIAGYLNVRGLGLLGCLGGLGGFRLVRGLGRALCGEPLHGGGEGVHRLGHHGLVVLGEALICQHRLGAGQSGAECRHTLGGIAVRSMPWALVSSSSRMDLSAWNRWAKMASNRASVAWSTSPCRASPSFCTVSAAARASTSSGQWVATYLSACATMS